MSELFDAVRECYTYPPDTNIVISDLYGENPWPEPLSTLGPEILSTISQQFNRNFTKVLFCAYKDGTAKCDEHYEHMDQVILSLGASRKFCLEDKEFIVSDGDTIFVPALTPHSIPLDSTPDERCALVFREK